jgi:hypothetical protein
MAVIIQEPLDNNPITEDWQKLLYRTTFQGGGYLNLQLINQENNAQPQIKKGSRLEVGGTFYFVSSNEAITTNVSLVSETLYYIYAVPNINDILGQNGLSFIYSSTAPTFDVIKGGWYNGANRAVAVFFYHAGNYYSKEVLHLFAQSTGIFARPLKRFQEYTSAGSFTFIVPYGVDTLYVTAIAGGAGGGGGIEHSAFFSLYGGFGGLAGQFIFRKKLSVTPNQLVPITVGAAGVGGAGFTQTNSNPYNGNPGGNTIVGSIILKGGTGQGAPGGNSLDGAPGTDLIPFKFDSARESSKGGIRRLEVNNNSTTNYAGGGAGGQNSPYGRGGDGADARENQISPGGEPPLTAYGAGGGGGGGLVRSGQPYAGGNPGGNGRNGCVLLEW